MGGNAFKHPMVEPHMRRIERSEIKPTLQFLASTLKYPGLDMEYVSNNLMGSTNKQADSGDIDIALEAARRYQPFMPKLTIEFPRGALVDIANRTEQKLGAEYVNRQGIKGGQLQTAWPIGGDVENGLIQVDFIHGDTVWLKFSHWSPGLDVSPFKGVFISTLLGLMAKMRKDFEYTNPETGERVARVGLRFDLEQGLYRQWELQTRPGMGTSKVDADYWETNFGRKLENFSDTVTKVERYTRLGYIKDPEMVLYMLYGYEVYPDEVDTFEKAWAKATEVFSTRLEEMKERLVEALVRSGAKYTYTKEEMVEMLNSL